MSAFPSTYGKKHPTCINCTTLIKLGFNPTVQPYKTPCSCITGYLKSRADVLLAEASA